MVGFWIVREIVIRCWSLEASGRIATLSRAGPLSYTRGMKTAVSIPDDVYRGAQRLARRTKKSRSRLVSDALREYLARHAPDDVTEAMDRACAEAGGTKDQFSSTAARRILESSEW